MATVGASSSEPDTMEAVLDLSPEEARTYSMILDAASSLPKTDPRFALTLTFTWWLLHRRRRLEQQRVRRRQFYRRLRRLIFLRWHLQRNTISGAAVASARNSSAVQRDLVVPDKRLWVRKDKNEDFWTKVDQNLITPEAFRKYFHMSRETFDYIYDELAEQLQKTNTTMRDPLPGKKRLAATIYRLATNAEYIKVANLFGIGKSTTTSLVRDVCDIIVSNLKDKFLTFIGEGLKPEDMKRAVDEAAAKFGIPKVVGILGSVDVMIIGSSWDWSEISPYISSYHRNYAVTFQAIVDSEGRFSHVFAGSPSSLTNKQIMETSNVKVDFLEKFSQGGQGEESLESQGSLPARIVADESYGSNDLGLAEGSEQERNRSATHNPDWLLTPEEIEAEVLDENEQQLLLEKITQARDLFDDAVFNVKSRWKIFHGKNGKIIFSASAFEKIALACCILHNICEFKEDEIDASWGTEVGPEVYNRKGYPKESSSMLEGDEEETADGEVEEEEEQMEGAEEMEVGDTDEFEECDGVADEDIAGMIDDGGDEGDGDGNDDEGEDEDVAEETKMISADISVDVNPENNEEGIYEEESENPLLDFV